MILSDAFCWGVEWGVNWLNEPTIAQDDTERYISPYEGEIVWVALKAPAKAIEEKESGKYISTCTLGTHSITELNKNCVYN